MPGVGANHRLHRPMLKFRVVSVSSASLAMVRVRVPDEMHSATLSKAHIQRSMPVYESSEMSRKISAKAVETEHPAKPGRMVYAPPQLIKLEPGTAEYERAKAAFELPRETGNIVPSDPEGSR